MTDETVILRKLTSLREHVARMGRRRADSFESFRRNVDLQDALSLSLLVAAQDAVDIALHISADEGWGIPASYSESFEILVNHDVIDRDLAVQLVNMASLRNRIAHGYASIDMERIYNELPRGLEAFGGYAAAIAQFLVSQAR